MPRAGLRLGEAAAEPRCSPAGERRSSASGAQRGGSARPRSGTSAGSSLPVIHTPSSDEKKGGTFARERKGEEEEKAPIPVPALAFPKAGKSHLDNAARTPAWLGAVCEEHPPPRHSQAFHAPFFQ